MLNLSTYDLVWFNHSLSGHGRDHRPMALCRCKSNSDVCTPDQTPIMLVDTRLNIVMHTLLTTLLISEFYVVVIRVGKKWEPRNPVPGPFSAKIRKVNQNSESRREFRK